MKDLSPGERFAGCRIEAVAGRGGMGVVYRATEIALGRRVALKVVAPEGVADTDFTDRFGREVRMAASIDHPNIVPVYGAGEEAGRLYLVMRYVDGTDLHALVRSAGRLEPARAAAIVAQVAAGLDAAHASGLVHRDVKPANVLLTQSAGPDGADHVYLTDFGLTVEVASGTRMTTTGHWIGSVDYMAPEQLRAEPVDARTDVYALGGVLHAALTGTAPFHRGTVPQTIAAHLHDPPPRPTDLVPVDPAFDAVVARALAKDPADRYRSAGDLGRAAQAAARGERVTIGERVVARGPAAPSEQRTRRLASPVTPTEVVGRVLPTPAPRRRIRPVAAPGVLPDANGAAARPAAGGRGEGAQDASPPDAAGRGGGSPAGVPSPADPPREDAPDAEVRGPVRPPRGDPPRTGSAQPSPGGRRERKAPGSGEASRGAVAPSPQPPRGEGPRGEIPPPGEVARRGAPPAGVQAQARGPGIDGVPAGGDVPGEDRAKPAAARRADAARRAVPRQIPLRPADPTGKPARPAASTRRVARPAPTAHADPTAAAAGGDPTPVRRHHRRSRVLLALAALVVLGAAGVAAGVLTNKPGTSSHRVSAYLSADEVRAAAQDFAAAYGHEDAAALRATLARDVQRVAPDGAQTGRENVLAVYRRQFAAADIDTYDLENLQIVPGAAGRAAGSYTVRRTGRDDISGRVAFGVIREAGRPRIAMIATQPD